MIEVSFLFTLSYDRNERGIDLPIKKPPTLMSYIFIQRFVFMLQNDCFLSEFTVLSFFYNRIDQGVFLQ